MSSAVIYKNAISKQQSLELESSNKRQSGDLKSSSRQKSGDLKIESIQDVDPKIRSYSEERNLGICLDKDKLSLEEQNSNRRSIRKCLRKDSRVCYTDLEGITVLKKIPEKDSLASLTERSDQEVLENADSYRSGESLFKTFTFEQTSDINDQETLKCIEFWKSVMKRNLAPIKCTLLEKGRDKKKTKKQSASSEKEIGLEEYEESEKNQDEDSLRIWSEAIKEIRRKKLDQVKLYYTERCKYCKDPFTKDLMDELGLPDKEELQKEIAGLADWQPEKKRTLEREDSTRLTSKIISGTSRRSFVETKESRISFKATSKETVPRSSFKANSGTSTGARKSALKNSSQLVSDDDTRSASPVQVSSAGVQAPIVKCTCDVDSCTCPHRAAERNSLSSFVEIARKSMLRDADRSVERFFPADTGPCVCATIKDYPWLQVTCAAEPCVSKTPVVEIQESSSDFNLDKIVGRGKHSPCVCRRYTNVICPSNECHFKESQGSLIQGFPGEVEDKIESTPSVSKSEECLCKTNSPDPAPAPEKPSPKCTCHLNLPWSQAICHSWSCPYRKLPPRKPDDDQKITMIRQPIIEDASTTCICGKHVWQQVECSTEECLLATVKKPKSEATMHPSKASLKHTSQSKERRKTVSEEKIAEKIIKPVKTDECDCSTSPAWVTAKCTSPFCAKRIAEEEDPTVQSLEPPKQQQVDKPELLSVDYSTCICSKEEQENEHFKCVSEECTMKTLDKTCLCETKQGLTCKAKTCVMKSKAAKPLKPTRDPKYLPKCKCKVRGYPTTKDINCTSPDCPFAKKHPKKKNIQLFIPNPRTTCRDACQYSDACRDKKEVIQVKLKDATPVVTDQAIGTEQICTDQLPTPSTFCKICGRFNCGHENQ